mgnify:CR=1 FL=1|jgi:PAS domain S-box-containing protein
MNNVDRIWELEESLRAAQQQIAELQRSEDRLQQLKWLLTKRVETTSLDETSPPQFYGDLTELNTSRVILDAIEKQTLSNIVLDYLVLLETSAAVYERNGDYALGIFSSGWCKLLDATSRRLCGTDDNREALESGMWHCHESCWNDASREAIEQRRPVDVPCSGGIRLYAVPIWADGDIVGAINFGYGNPPTYPDALREIAERYQLPIDMLRKQAKAYEPRPPFIIDLAKRRLKTSAQLIGKIVVQQRTKEVLREREARLQSILRAVPTGIGLVSDRRLLQVNDRICQMIGYTRDELIGKDARILYPTDEDYEYVGREKYAQIAEEGIGTVETRWLRKDGAIINVLLSSAPIDPHNLIAGITFTALDITKRKKAEKALQEYHEHLEDLVQERTAKLQTIIDAMTGREVRMAELKTVIRQLRRQIEEAGMAPIADDPLLGDE